MIAVLSLQGVIAQRMNMLVEYSGGTSTEIFGRQFDQAVSDKSISAIVLDVDSPGGEVFGVDELSQAIYSARGEKPILAVANSMMASAAYWIASAADEVAITPGGEAGSIGVVAVHVDTSKAAEMEGLAYSLISAGRYKVEGNAYAPLEEGAREMIQGRVDDYYDMFVAAVVRNRKMSAGQVRRGMGQGRMLGAKAAVAEGLVDRIETLDGSLQRVGRSRAGRSRTRAEKRLALMRLSV